MVYYFDCSHAGEDPEFKNVPAGYINKTLCGCGLTSVALEGDEDCIIAVPNVSLVKNKVRQYYNTQEPIQGDPNSGPRKRFGGEVFGVYGDVEWSHICKYLKRVEAAGTPIKLLVTYDSLHKVYSLLKTDKEIAEGHEKGLCHLIIDESDKLISYMSMKVNSKKPEQYMDIVTYLFKVAELCKSTVSFISATPIDVAYLPPFVSEIEQVELHWKNTEKVTPITLKRAYPYNALQDEVIRPMAKDGKVHLGDRDITKVIVFINSVDKIMQIVKECKLDRDEVALICGDNSRNSYKIRNYNTLDDPYHLPKYTFVTSSGFQGIDLVDAEAMNVVVSNTGKSYQMVDLNTDLIQATSRQRDKSNPNFNRFVYIYDQSPFGEKTEEDLITEMDAVHQRIEDNCETLKKMDKLSREYTSTVETFSQSEDFRRYTYKLTKDGDYELNEIVFRAEKYQILETRKRYTEGFDIIKDYSESREVKPIPVPEPQKHKKLSYISIMHKYKKVIKDMTPIYSFDLESDNIFDSFTADKEEPEKNERGYIIVDRSKFDEEELASKNFQIVDSYYKAYGKFTDNSNYARRMARVVGDEADQFKVEIQSIFGLGRYSLEQIKTPLNKLYARCGITRKAKDSDLQEYGYKTKRVRPQGHIFVDIIELPKVD